MLDPTLLDIILESDECPEKFSYALEYIENIKNMNEQQFREDFRASKIQFNKL